MSPLLPLVGDESWRFVNPSYFTEKVDEDNENVCSWHVSNDTTFIDGKIYRVSYCSEDILQVLDLETGKKYYLVDINLPPKVRKTRPKIREEKEEDSIISCY
jgi:hypothetical protein